MNGNGITASLGSSPAQNSQAPPPVVPLTNALALTAAATPAVPLQTTIPMPQMLPQIPPKSPVVQQISTLFPPSRVQAPSPTMSKNAPTTTAAVGAAPGTVRSGNGGGGQLLQFPWKLHEMLHLAEKNGKTNIISWLPGGNGFKVHNKEKFCAEIMPGYFASQKYKTFQRSLNLWGFESVAKGPDRGACYHQYFVKGHPELCHSMTRVKIKGQSNPRTPAAAAAAAAAAAKRAAMAAAMTAANQQQVQQSQQGLVAQQQQVLQHQAAQQPLNIFTMNHFLPGVNMGMPHLGMQMAGGNPAAANVNPYAVAMNNFAAMNALQQINPAFAAAALQNPAMNAVIAAQVMGAAANNQHNNPAVALGAVQQARAVAAQQHQQQQQQQPLAPVSQRRGVAPVPGPAMTTPATAPSPMAAFAPGMATPVGAFPQQLQQQQQQLQLQQQQLGMAPAAPTPVAPTTAGPASSMPSSASANANYAEFLARKAAMEHQQQQLHQHQQQQQQQLHQHQQQQQQAMLSAASAKANAVSPANNTLAGPLAANAALSPAGPVNVSEPEVNNYGTADGVEDLVAV